MLKTNFKLKKNAVSKGVREIHTKDQDGKKHKNVNIIKMNQLKSCNIVGIEAGLSRKLHNRMIQMYPFKDRKRSQIRIGKTVDKK